MMNGGEAADQMVSFAYKGGEVVLRLAGDGAKHLAAYLASILQNPRPGKGAVKLKRLLAEGRELSVQRMNIHELETFRKEAKKYGVEFCILKNTNLGDGRCDILYKTEDSHRVNRMFENLELTREPDTASIQSEIIRDREERSRESGESTENPPTAGRTEPERRAEPGTGAEPASRASADFSPTSEIPGEKPSVRAALERIRAARRSPVPDLPAPARTPRVIPKGKTDRGR